MDIAYLRGLSYDDAPEIQKLYISIKSSPDLKEKQIAEEILGYFKESKLNLKNQKNWQNYNISKYKAEKIIDKYIK